MYQLTAGDFSLQVTPLGAEMVSLKRGETEYLWQADPAIWGRHAPLLFPIVGRLRNDRFRTQEGWYTMHQHGFARDKMFKVVEQGPTHLRLMLREDKDSLKIFPFGFTLYVTYELAPYQVKVSLKVLNSGSDYLPFTLGAHPAFRVPLSPEEDPRDYAIVFEQRETAERHLLQDGLFDGRTAPCLLDSDRIPWRPDLFDDDALIFHHLRSSYVALAVGDRRRVTVSIDGFPYLGIWAKPGAPFVCLEPWHGLADHARDDVKIFYKKGMFVIRPGNIYDTSFTITCD